MPDDPDALTAAAVRAFRQTRFFAEVYGTEPAEPDALPFLTDADYHRAAGLLDCVVDRAAVIGVIPPFDRDGGRFPYTVAEDEAELILRQARIVRAMLDLGVDFAAAPRFLVVADARRGPFACELAKGFYWEGFQTSLAFDCPTADILRAEVDRHEPDYVVLASGRHLRHALDRPRETVWLVDHCGSPPVDDPEFPTLLYADGVDLIGSRAAGGAGFDVDADQLLVETNPASGLSHVTKLKFTCFPLVRYGLGRRVVVGEPAGAGVP